MSAAAFRIQPARIRTGEIRVGGFKHLLGPMFATAVSAGVELRLRNAPRLAETEILFRTLGELGVPAGWHGDEAVVHGRALPSAELPRGLTEQIHGGMYLIPALLGRTGRVRFASFGGCPIGSGAGGGRPVRHILQVLERFGARFERVGDGVEGRAEGLRGADLDVHDWSDAPGRPSGPLLSGATKAAIVAALAAEGTTVIRNPYRKPDVLELLAFARAAGWVAEDGGAELRICRAPGAGRRPVEHALISDLPEIVTFIACAVHTETPLTLGAVTSEAARAGLAAELELLDEMGVGVEWGDQRVRVHPGDNVRPVRIDVSPDGVYSDHAPFFALMGCRARGRSVIRERVWTRRFAYVPELVKLGAAMSVSGSELNVRPRRLSGADGDLHATDLRAAAVLTLAALDSPRPTRITGVHHLARGYENLARKLTALGAHIEEER